MVVSLARTLILYAVIIFAVRVMGKRQISQMQTSELVVTLLISDLAVIPMQNVSLPLAGGLIPIVVLVFCEIFASVLMLRFPKVRRMICGQPVVVIAHGKINQENMKALRMTLEDLFEQLRQKDVKSLNEIDYAIMETNGMLSVVRYDKESPVTPKQLKIPVEDEGLSVVLIDDGNWCPHSLMLCGKTQQWGADVLRERKVALKDVFLMTLNHQGKICIIKRTQTRGSKA